MASVTNVRQAKKLFPENFIAFTNYPSLHIRLLGATAINIGRNRGQFNERPGSVEIPQGVFDAFIFS
jgi:hypothetical protein